MSANKKLVFAMSFDDETDGKGRNGKRNGNGNREREREESINITLIPLSTGCAFMRML